MIYSTLIWEDNEATNNCFHTISGERKYNIDNIVNNVKSRNKQAQTTDLKTLF